MIHRGTEYARAIKKFYKKNGRYPASLDDLDKGQIKFLRKRYKDPLTKDGKWKLLNYGDIASAAEHAAPGTPAAAMGTSGGGNTRIPVRRSRTPVLADRLGSGGSFQPQQPQLQQVQQQSATAAGRLQRRIPVELRYGRHQRREQCPAVHLRASNYRQRLRDSVQQQPYRNSSSGMRNVEPGGIEQQSAEWNSTVRIELQRQRADVRRRSDCRRRQPEQGSHDSHLQQEEDLRRVAVHLQPDDGPDQCSAARPVSADDHRQRRTLALRPAR